jgi:hypothetical protein
VRPPESRRRQVSEKTLALGISVNRDTPPLISRRKVSLLDRFGIGGPYPPEDSGPPNPGI